jgi:hypothetical protein
MLLNRNFELLSVSAFDLLCGLFSDDLMGASSSRFGVLIECKVACVANLTFFINMEGLFFRMVFGATLLT